MTQPFTGHPFDPLAILANNFVDGSGNPVTLPGILEAEFDAVTYRFDTSGLSTSEASLLRDLTESAFAEIALFTALTFAEVAEGAEGAAHIDIAYNGSLSGGGETFFTYRDDTDAGFDLDALEADMQIRVINAYTVIHELGHALTLEHTSPEQDPPHLPYLAVDEQNNNFTVMHYDLSSGGVSVADGEWFYEGYQLNDVYALQLRFGANPTTYLGDTTYFAASTWADREGYMVTLYDAGGTDTLQYANVARDQFIDLRDGRFSDAGHVGGAAPGVASTADPLALDYTQPVYTLAIAYGTEIEHANGGTGDDVLMGNDLANVLNGGAGNDLLIGDGTDALLLQAVEGMVGA